MDRVPRWRIGFDVRSPDVGAAAAFDQIVDYDDRPPLPVPGLVDVLSTWLWQKGLDTRWWLGAIVEAPSATSAAERVASVVEARTRTAGVRTRTVTIHVTASTARTTEELVEEEEVDRHAIPGSASPFIVPVRARAHARGRHVVVEVGDLPAGLPVLDRYSGEYLP